MTIAATYAMLVSVLPDRLNVQTVGALVFLALVGLTVVVRQIIAFADNARLLDRLDVSLLDLRRQEERFRALVQHSSDIILIIDSVGLISYVSPGVQPVLGAAPDEVVGRRWEDWVHPDDLPSTLPVVGELLAEPGASRTHQARVRHADGDWRWLDMVFTNYSRYPTIGGVVCNAREVTEARRLQDRLRHQATHDALTDVANRVLFTERLKLAAASGEQVAVLLIDLDGFKAINDTLGHHVGDETLVGVARRLRECVRAGDTVARLGGDEFAVLAPAATLGAATEVAKRFISRLAAPIPCGGHPVAIGASVGVAAGVGEDPEVLLRLADSAMYRAKRAGRGPQRPEAPEDQCGQAVRTEAFATSLARLPAA